MDLNTDTGESLLQLEIRKCQQAFAMSSHDEPEEFEDIQFFHRIPPVALSSFKPGTTGDILRGGYMTAPPPPYPDGDEQDSDSSYMFPENVMEYGEPQFFPGNCVGYLETILEETDEDCEEEEGSSGRHWWTPDSDTDTESVIRLESTNPPANTGDQDSRPSDKVLFVDFLQRSSSSGGGRCSIESSSSDTALTSTNPFEMEELYLFDQLDLAFEETLMKPRRRTGIAFDAMDLHLPPFKGEPPPTTGSNNELPEATIGQLAHQSESQAGHEEEVMLTPEEGQGPDESDEEEPPVVNEEDFFCSSSQFSSTSEEEEDPLQLSETEDSTTTSGSNSSGEEEKPSGIVLAEFSLNPFNNGPNNEGSGEMYVNPHRRSFEAPSKIRSFRSYDSLNSLLGTELLFSAPESFPPISLPGNNPFHNASSIPEILPEAEEDEGGSGGCGSRSSSTEDKETASRKNSGEVSSENLSEDSGIHDILPVAHDLPIAHAQDLPKPEFALNPFIYSSASEENSLMSSSSTNYASSDIFEKIKGSESESSSSITNNTSESCGKVINNCWEREEVSLITSYITTTSTTTTQKRAQVPSVNNGEVESGPMSTLGSCSSPTTIQRTEGRSPGSDDEEIKDALTQLISLPPLTKGSAGEERGVGSFSTIPAEPDEDSARGGTDEDANPPVEDLTSNIQHHNNPLPGTQSILSVSNLGSEENRSSEEEEQESDYVTLVRKEEKGNYSGQHQPSSVSVSSSLGTDQEEALLLQQSLTQEQQYDKNMQVEPNSGIPIKTYGGVGNNDVAVYLVTSGSGGSRTPSPTVPSPDPGQMDTGSLTKTKTVHFSPVVSEISWRESYAEPSGDDIEPSSPADHGGSDGPIEKVHVHSQILSEPYPMVIPRSEKERLMALEPTGHDDDDDDNESPGLMPMSTVPDLLSQCREPGHGSGDEVDAAGVNGERPYYYQQQIFPAMFVASAKEAAEANQVNLKKNGKKATYVAPPIVPPVPPAPVKPPKGTRSENGSDTLPLTTGPGDKIKESKSKPGFFQRLTKIRLSGKSASSTQPKAPKTKIYPKEIEPLNSRKGTKGTSIVPLGPILKKGSTPLVLQNNSPGTPPPLLKQNGTPPPKEQHQDECSEAFENILEEIAGLNTILQRQQFPPSHQQQQHGEGSGGKRSFADRKQFLINPDEAVVLGQVSTTLDTKLSQFKEDTSRTRDHISRSHPDLETMQGMTARQVRGASPPHDMSMSPSSTTPGTRAPGSADSRKTEREWYRLLRSAAEKYYHGGRPGGRGEDGSYKTGIVETDLDTGTSRELLDAELVIRDELSLGPPPPLPTSLPPNTTNGATPKAQSLTNLTSGLKLSIAPHDSSQGIDDDGEERAKSLEFLLDEEQKSAASPPENRLREENRQLSEHELRIQRSLQKINVPDWYRRHSYRSKSMERDRDRSAELRKDTPLVTPNGSTPLKLLKRSDYGSAGGLAGGWAGLSAYRTPSLSSLQNGGLTTGSLNRSNFVRGRPVTMSATRSSRESLLSPSSTASQSPSAFERCSFTYGMPLTLTRYGKGRLSSTSGTSPGSSPSSTPGQPATLSAFVKQPYLGWRSQERLNQVGTPAATGGLKLSAYRSPAERLAADILTKQKRSPARPTGPERPPLPKWPSRSSSEKSKTMSLPPVATEVVVATTTPPQELTRYPSPTIHDSIREVTDAINEFVTHGSEGPPKPQPRGKHVKKQALWFESSFVGKKTQAQ